MGRHGKFRRDDGVNYALENFTVAAGARQILFNTLMAGIDQGDGVIMRPAWPNLKRH